MRPAMMSRASASRAQLVVVHVADDGIADGRLGVHGVALAEHPQAHSAAVGHAAGIGFDGAGEHAQQAGLAVAVAADDADHVSGVDAERDGVEDDAGGVLWRCRASAPRDIACHIAL